MADPSITTYITTDLEALLQSAVDSAEQALAPMTDMLQEHPDYLPIALRYLLPRRNVGLRMTEQLAKVVYFVQATDEEIQGLWRRHSSGSQCIEPQFIWRKVSWEEKHPSCFSYTIGWVLGKLVTLTIRLIELNGCLVCFYDSGSRVCDWEMVHAVLKERHRPTYGGQLAYTNASNFHLILNRCLEEV